MIRTIAPLDMRDMEQAFMEKTGYPSLLLMEHAAQAVVEKLAQLVLPTACVAFVCGTGNNGGDGYAAARLWKQRGGRAQVIALCPLQELTGDAASNARVLRAMDCPIEESVGGLLELLPECEMIVDAIFGTGLTREVLGDYAVAIDQIGQSKLPVLAVDIASGIDGATGAVRGCAVCAQWTVTFHRPKTGHYLFPGRAHTGELTVADIGIFSTWDDADGETILDTADMDALLPARERNTHKGTYGRVLAVAGSRGMAGAAALCALGSVHGGAGLSCVATVKGALVPVQTLCPCATVSVVPDDEGSLSALAAPKLLQLAAQNDVLAIGPGLGMSEGVWEAIAPLVHSDFAKVLDADALNLLAHHAGQDVGENTVLTPHPGEMARLLGEGIEGILAEPIASAQALAQRFHAVVLLKGATSVITNGEETMLNITGCAGMATGGSGDVLTGVIAALMAQGLSPYDAACAGAYLHGQAGARARETCGERAMSAMDIVQALR